MITIITKGYCPYCAGAITLLNKVWVKYMNIDVTLKPDLYDQVKEITGSQTVPQVFMWDIHWKFLGWFTELNELHKSGELEKLIK